MAEILKEYNYTPAKLHRGYANKSLYINVGDLSIVEKEVTQWMKDKFVGGKGFDLWYLWNAVTPETKWDSPRMKCDERGTVSALTQYSGTGKTLVASISQ